ncbi:MAG: PAS domain-containing protein [Bacteroidetes bacterium]|nr:PAS domain-containing protein [Bacteroidota bacterium]MDA0860106.1 PAS domain-containing protein [Bacteroidota bacterium]MDA1318203.1 PAS domain-containing protein [Bacteroidota bacterium]
MKQDLNNMMCLDIYLSGNTLKKSDQKIISNTMEDDCSKLMPLISWGMFSEHYFKKLNTSKKCMDLKKIKSFARKYGWENNIETLFKSVDFSAIILTDKNKKIKWVNDGFTDMTGYTKKEAIKKTAGFLQGPKTSKRKKAEIEFKLKENKPFKTSLINYRKNKSIYTCEVHIFPLFNKVRKTTHFIALEREVL